jgi:hypothetical protein
MSITAQGVLAHAGQLYQVLYERGQEVDEELAERFVIAPGTVLYQGRWSKDLPDSELEDGTRLGALSTMQLAMKFLVRAGCVTILRRGSRDYPTAILLNRPPEAEDAKELGEQFGTRRSADRQLLIQTSQQVLEVVDRLTCLEREVAGLVADFDQKLAALARRVESAA